MNFINIIGTLFDNSISHIVAIANQIWDLRLNRNQQDINEDLYDRISRVDAKKEKSKGFFPSLASLQNAEPEPLVGDWATISENSKIIVCRCETEGIWTKTSEEVSLEVPLYEYAKRNDLKTINGQAILIDSSNPLDNNIQVEGGEQGFIPIASSESDGLLSKELYNEWDTLKTTTIIELDRRIENLESLVNTNDLEIQNIITKYNVIKDFISNINPNSDVLSQIITDISSLQNAITVETTRALSEENSLKSRVKYLEQNGTEGFHHIILTQAEYDALNSYDNRTIYLIISSRDSWGLGDPLPIILASENSEQENPEPEDTTWKFGQQFPIIFE